MDKQIQPLASATSHAALLSGSRIVTVTQVPEIIGYQWLTKHSLRHMIFAASDRFNSKGEKIPGNGMNQFGVIIRVGRKVLIDLDAFDKWLETRREIVRA